MDHWGPEDEEAGSSKDRKTVLHFMEGEMISIQTNIYIYIYLNPSMLADFGSSQSSPTYAGGKLTETA
jgi:hypothetical protein